MSSSRVAERRGAFPWQTLGLTGLVLVVTLLQYRWGGFGYVPTTSRMAPPGSAWGVFVRGWLSGSTIHAVVGVVAFALASFEIERRLGSAYVLFTSLCVLLLAAVGFTSSGSATGPAALGVFWAGTRLYNCAQLRRRPRGNELVVVVLAVVASSVPGSSALGLGGAALMGLAVGWNATRGDSAALSRAVPWTGAVLLAGTLTAAAIGWPQSRPWDLVEEVELEKNTIVIVRSNLFEVEGEPLPEPRDLLLTFSVPPGMQGPSDFDHRLVDTTGPDEAFSYQTTLRPFAHERDVVFGIDPTWMIQGEAPPTEPLWIHVWGTELDCEEPSVRYDAVPVAMAETDELRKRLDYRAPGGLEIRTRTIEAPFGCAYIGVYAWAGAPEAQRAAAEAIVESLSFEH